MSPIQANPGDDKVTRRHFLQVLCAIAIFATQLAAVFHATQHELANAGGVHCELCEVAHAAPVPPSPVLVPVVPRFDIVLAPVAPAGPEDRRPFSRPHSRAPPRVLA
ncbi:MAG TPA: DUF2946 family protein [Nevskiaceae bacterium]|nr:DUF2946 family protein [Nevskiaceae bacterium]